MKFCQLRREIDWQYVVIWFDNTLPTAQIWLIWLTPVWLIWLTVISAATDVIRTCEFPCIKIYGGAIEITVWFDITQNIRQVATAISPFFGFVSNNYYLTLFLHMQYNADCLHLSIRRLIDTYRIVYRNWLLCPMYTKHNQSIVEGSSFWLQTKLCCTTGNAFQIHWFSMVSTYLSLSVRPPVRLCPSVRLSVSLSVRLSACLSVGLYVCWPFVCPSVCLFVSLGALILIRPNSSVVSNVFRSSDVTRRRHAFLFDDVDVCLSRSVFPETTTTTISDVIVDVTPKPIRLISWHRQTALSRRRRSYSALSTKAS